MTSLFVFTDVVEELENSTVRDAVSTGGSLPMFGKADLSRSSPLRKSKPLTLFDLNETLMGTKEEAEIDSAFAIGAIYMQG
jgi:hypothetical protein